MRLQPEKSACEDIQDVKIMVKERIKAWQIANRKLPKNILYYRDGVSDSVSGFPFAAYEYTDWDQQYAQVRDRELPQIRAAFEEHAKSQKMATKVKLTAVVVAKRHNVKLLPESDDPNYAKQINGKEKNGNCRPGTLVDTVVTSPYYSDFYLQSHDGIKGTAKSAHYFLLANEMKLRDTELQEFVSDYEFLFCFVNGQLTFRRRPTNCVTRMFAQQRVYPMPRQHTTPIDSAIVAGRFRLILQLVHSCPY